MTVSSTSTYVRLAGNDSANNIDTTFPVFDESDLVVTSIASTGISTPFVLGTDYTVSIDTDNIATVTLTATPVTGETIDVRSLIPLTQSTSVRNLSRYLPEIHEDEFDMLLRQIQDTRRIANNAVRIPDTEAGDSDLEIPGTVTQRASKLLGFAGDGKSLVVAEPGGEFDSTLRAELAAGLSVLVSPNSVDSGYQSNKVKYDITPDEQAAGVTPVNYYYISAAYLFGNVLRYGADNSGILYSTSAFQAALNSNKIVYIPDGTYKLDCNVLYIPIGVEILLSRGATIDITTSVAGYIFNCLGSNKISGGTFTCSSDYPVIAHIVGSITNVSLVDVIANGPRLVESNTSAANYAAANDSNSPDGITVSRCRAVHSVVNTSIGCVELLYCRNFVVSDNVFIGCFYGAMFWGGDSAIDGTSITNARKSRNGTISGNNYIGGATGVAAYWGSMGQDITITGNTANGGSDVGIDFEGCISCTAVGNTVRDFVNGCYSTFFYCRGIIFSGNTATVNNSSYPLFKLYNVSASVTNNFDILVIGNTFTCLSGIGQVTHAGPSRTFVFKNNSCTNVKFGFASSANFNRIEVSDNTWIFETNPGSSFNAIDTVGGIINGSLSGNVKISGNCISAMFTPNAGSIGIRVNTYDFNASSIVVIEGNRISQFPSEITLVETGSNGGQSGFYLIRENHLDSGFYTRTESGAKNMTALLVDNYLSNPLPFPNAVPGSGRWDVGQKVWFSAPASGAAPGAICVTAGTPGTFKNMAVLA